LKLISFAKQSGITGKVIGYTDIEKGYDFKKMCVDWNSDTLKFNTSVHKNKLDGVKTYKKLETHLIIFSNMSLWRKQMRQNF
jgi:hypothetical protein